MVKGVSVTSVRPWGLPDDAFEQRRPLRGQITKREVRAVSLYLLGLKYDSVVWDIGAGTGSVAIESSLISRDGEVYALERDENSIELLRNNVERWGAGNIRIVVGEAPATLSGLPDPDSVFVGGSSGRLGEILDEVARRLKPEGKIVVNLAALERTQETYHRLKGLGFSPELVSVNAARGKELKDGTVRLEALNPVFVISAFREGAENE
ncbi:MAG TPA: precorrin-6Y C5,15-methyltransferase (decarboxylating) subunit CbiT [Dehalococcoidia bacterium]|jgi:precorrin-6Y C5,15-methyltransferase (decarboxylating)|nr:precorrin-6Y C5,15-methyltransferase (decarboxylating) subunit CbiT [Dehalococcoidia bacterium]